MTYTELKTNIAAYLHRTDLTAQLDTFIQLAEAFLFRELSVTDLEVSVTGTATLGTITLPADFGTLSKITITYSGREIALDSKATDYPYSTSGRPLAYLIENGAISLFPTPDTGYPYTLQYTPVMTPLSSTVSTNWLIEQAPDLYLMACQYQGTKYIEDTAAGNALVAEMLPMLDSVQRLIKRKQATRGTLQIRAR